MSAVPEAKAGVGSAMSDVTRQVGGALGVAVIGSLIGSAYSRDMDGRAGAAAESIGAAHAVAAQLGGAAGRELADDRRAGVHGRARHRPDRRRGRRAGRALLVLLRLPSGRSETKQSEAARTVATPQPVPA